MAIPSWFTETFIIEHDRLDKTEAQLQKYQQNEKLYGSALDLSEKVTRLESQKAQAYRDGYNEAFKRYDSLNHNYIKELKKPRFDFGGMFGKLACVAAGAGGFYLGTRF